MVARRRRRNGNLWYLVVFLVLLAVAVAMGYKVWEVYFKDTGKGGETEVVEDSSKSEVEKKEEVEKVEEVEETKQEETLPVKSQYEGEDPNTNGGITGVMTYAGVSDSVLVIRVSIDQYLSGGNCALTLKRDDKVFYTEEVEVADSAATATCEGFNVPLTQISESGEINVRITVNSGEKSGIIEGKVNI